MSLNSSLIIAAFAELVLLASSIVVPVSAHAEPTQPLKETKGCGDLSDAMTALIRAHKELTEAAERIKSDKNKEIIQVTINETEESIKKTDSVMDSLNCAKRTN